MKNQIVGVSEAARSFSDLIDRVLCHSQQFDIQRGRDIVACLVPPEPRTNLPVAQLNEVFAELPRLERNDREAFAQQVQLLREEMRYSGGALE